MEQRAREPDAPATVGHVGRVVRFECTKNLWIVRMKYVLDVRELPTNADVPHHRQKRT